MLDSGATKHICNDVNTMLHVSPAPGWSVTCAAWQRGPVNGTGDALFGFPAGGPFLPSLSVNLFGLANGQLLLQEVLLVPSMSTSLLSISALFGCLAQRDCCAVHYTNELVAPRCAGSYTVHAPKGAAAAVVTAHAPATTWHRRHAGHE
jgi:hypothetical protein